MTYRERSPIWDQDETMGEVKSSSEPLTDPEKIESLITANLKSSFVFVQNSNTKEVDQFTESGWLCRSFTLEDVREWVGYPKNHCVLDQKLFLPALDRLTKSGRLKIHRVDQERTMDFYNCTFHCVLADAKKSYQGQVGPKYKSMRFFSDKPIKKSEFDQHNLIDISGKVLEIREHVRERLRKHFAPSGSGLDMENLLRKEDREDEAALRQEILRLLGSKIKEQNEKK